MDFNNTRRANFLGHDGFIWWVGIIEDRMDPLNLGRCKVRIKGIHSEDQSKIETASLPWSQILFPVNNSNSTPTTLKEGDMVIGFFMDGDAAQFPVIFGTFHGIPEDPARPGSGFSDQRTAEQLKSSPKKPKSVKFKSDGKGATIEENDAAENYPNRLDEPTTSRLARNESISDTIIQSKKDNITKGVKTAKDSSWDEPKTPYAAKYPYNQVISTESGHYFELDDTPSAERMHLYHRSGTFTETHPDGTQVVKIVKDKYSIVMKDDHVYIMGECNVTVQGNAEVYVGKNCDLKVDGNLEFNVKKNFKLNVGGDMTTEVSGNIKQTSAGDTLLIGATIEAKNG